MLYPGIVIADMTLDAAPVLELQPVPDNLVVEVR